jgi:iron complex outermembrane receptor protein
MDIDGRQRSVESLEPGQPNALPRVINGDQQFNGFEVTLDWLPTDTVRLGLITTVRDDESSWEDFYNSIGELQSEKTSGSTDTAYTLTFDWAPQVSFGSLNWHMDYIYGENNADKDPAAITSVIIGGVDTSIPYFGKDSKLLNSRLAWASNDGHYEVAVWGQNLLNNKVTNSLGGRTLDAFGTGYLDISAPRTYGIDLRYNL